jgi:uncharacterized RDD family membrane protein YckC
MSARRNQIALLHIATPEGVTFSLPLAGPVTRALAFFLDLAVALAIQRVVMLIVAVVTLVAPDIGGFGAILVQFIIFNGYSAICEMLWNGKTMGKHVVGIRVMDERGLRLQPHQVLIRNLVRFVDALPICYALGGAVCFFSPRCQRLGDLAAGTVVVRNVKIVPPNVEGVIGERFNSFRQYPHLEARLRQNVSAEDAQMALSALIRREDLESESAIQLFGMIAQRFRDVVNFPDEATIGLTDEQYVRNVMDSVYRRPKRSTSVSGT